eukprot:716285-Rhodomonas_salina.2
MLSPTHFGGVACIRTGARARQTTRMTARGHGNNWKKRQGETKGSELEERKCGDASCLDLAPSALHRQRTAPQAMLEDTQRPLSHTRAPRRRESVPSFAFEFGREGAVALAV